MTPYYEDDFATIFHGDCRDVLPSLVDEFDAGFADPPYNVGLKYVEHQDAMTPDDYLAFSREWFRALRDVVGGGTPSRLSR